MQFAELSAVKNRIALGAPVPFNIRNADRTLLLARGQVIGTQAQLDALLERGALVDIEEARTARYEVEAATAEELPQQWEQCMKRVGRTLGASVHAAFAAALDQVARPVLALIERDPDLAIFQVVRQEAAGHAQYGVMHSLHTAIASHLVARRLQWDATRVRTVFKAALTMNLSMLELQGRLALQLGPPTAAQRQAIHEHPLRSAEMLHAWGIDDEEWLEAVAQHHEIAGGSGYPRQLREVGDMAGLLRRADAYTAKLSARATRCALPAHRAGRDLFMQDQGHPMAAAIVKEFGVYPPGSFVRLHSGEMGVVVRRGPHANTPLVATLTNRQGEPLITPQRRNTAEPQHAIAAAIDEQQVKVRLSTAKLAALTGA